MRDERIPELAARGAIKELRYDYARRLDDRDWEGWASLFTEDAHCEYEGWGTVDGRDELRSFAADVVAEAFEYTAHIMNHPTISVDGCVASGQWYVQIYYARSDGVGGWRQGRYEDEYRRVDGEWLFAAVSHSFFARRELDYELVVDDRYGELVEFHGGESNDG